MRCRSLEATLPLQTGSMTQLLRIWLAEATASVMMVFTLKLKAPCQWQPLQQSALDKSCCRSSLLLSHRPATRRLQSNVIMMIRAFMQRRLQLQQLLQLAPAVCSQLPCQVVAQQRWQQEPLLQRARQRSSRPGLHDSVPATASASAKLRPHSLRQRRMTR